MYSEHQSLIESRFNPLGHNAELALSMMHEPLAEHHLITRPIREQLRMNFLLPLLLFSSLVLTIFAVS